MAQFTDAVPCDDSVPLVAQVQRVEGLSIACKGFGQGL